MMHPKNLLWVFAAWLAFVLVFDFDRVDALVSISKSTMPRGFQAKGSREVRTSSHVRAQLRGDEGNDGQPDTTEEDETQKLQEQLNNIVAEPKMFGSFDTENFDADALPVPLFTSIVILVGSLIWTYALFDAGINGI